MTGCTSCGTSLAPAELACPQCHQLAYATRLEEFAARARGREAAGDTKGAIDLWNKALELLPPEAAQAASIRDHVAELGARRAVKAALPQARPNWTKRLGPFGVGFILGIYVHEMGHIWALRQFGLRASAPMFIPGFGAFVSLYDSPQNVG